MKFCIIAILLLGAMLATTIESASFSDVFGTTTDTKSEAGAVTPGTRLFVSGFGPDYPADPDAITAREWLEQVFGACGEVTEIYMGGNPRDHHGYDFAVVTMKDENAAQTAIKTLNEIQQERPIYPIGYPVEVVTLHISRA